MLPVETKIDTLAISAGVVIGGWSRVFVPGWENSIRKTQEDSMPANAGSVVINDPTAAVFVRVDRGVVEVFDVER